MTTDNDSVRADFQEFVDSLQEHGALAENVSPFGWWQASRERYVPKWIPVSERLPEDLEVTLCANELGGTWIAQHYRGEWNEEEQPILWMPIIATPNGGNGE